MAPSHEYTVKRKRNDGSQNPSRPDARRDPGHPDARPYKKHVSHLPDDRGYPRRMEGYPGNHY